MKISLSTKSQLYDELTVTESTGPAGCTLARARVRVVITRPSIAAAHSLITVDDLI